MIHTRRTPLVGIYVRTNIPGIGWGRIIGLTTDPGKGPELCSGKDEGLTETVGSRIEERN